MTLKIRNSRTARLLSFRMSVSALKNKTAIFSKIFRIGVEIGSVEIAYFFLNQADCTLK